MGTQYRRDERRRCPRYAVSGRAEMHFGDVDATGQLVGLLLDIGTGGALIASEQLPAQGSSITLRFTIDGYAGEFHTTGRVVRTQLNVLAVMFLTAPAGAEGLISWLEKTQSQQ